VRNLRQAGGAVFGTAESVVSAVTGPFVDFFNHSSGSSSSGQVASLQRQVIQLRAELSQEQLSKAEYRQLSSTLQLAGRGGYRIVAATVIAMGQGYSQTVTLDAGTADGIKTGHTDEAGFGLTASVKRGGRHIIMVATGLTSMKGRSQEAERIVDYAFREFQNFQIIKPGEAVDEAEVWLGDKPKVPLVTAGGLVVSMARTARKDMKVTVSYDGPIKAPIQEGQQIGTLTVTAPDTPTQSVPVVAGAAVGELGRMGRISAALEHMIWGSAH